MAVSGDGPTFLGGNAKKARFEEGLMLIDRKRPWNMRWGLTGFKNRVCGN